MNKKRYMIRNKTVSARSAVLFFIFTLIFLVVIIKLAYLQLYANNKYSIEEYRDSITYKTLEAKRGDIFDRNGNVLAKSINVYTSYFSTYDFNKYKEYSKEFKEKEDEKLNKIFNLLQLNKEEIFKKAEGLNNLFIKDELSEENIEKIKSYNSNMISFDGNKCYFSVQEYNKFKKFEEDVKKKEEEKLNAIFELIEVDKIKVFNRADSGTNFKIKESIEPEIAKEILELQSSIVSVEIEQSRNYVDGTFAPYVIGHSNENGGQAGIENYFNDYLAGKNGAKKVIREHLNKKVETEIPEENGKNVYLTIDSSIQEFVSRYAKEYYEKENPIKLTVIVSDLNNGDILAMENYPKYNLNDPDAPRNSAEESAMAGLSGKELLDKKFTMWRNSAISDLYEPGSVFKLITAASSLDEDTSTLESKFYCDGFITDIPGIKIRCFNWQNPHGTQTFTEAMDNSCNPAFVQMARKLGRDNMYKYIYGFGFGEKTGVELPGESVGQVPKTEGDIGSAELATMSFGHGISTTPLQMMFAANSLVNGGYILQPQITLKNVERDGHGELKIRENDPIVKRQVISKETSDKMRDVMEHGVDEGIAKRVAVNGMRIGAKTGTSIKAIQGTYDDYKVFASIYVAFPIEKPKYSIMIVFDEPKGAKITGSSVAAPLAKKIVEDITKYKQIPNSENYKEVVKENVEVPDLVGLTAEYATELLSKNFLDVEFETTGNDKSIVVKQSVEAKDRVAEGSVIKLSLTSNPEEKLKVLDFTGMTYDQAMDIVKKMGYTYRTSGGKGNFKSQNKEKNSFISKDEELVLTFDGE